MEFQLYGIKYMLMDYKIDRTKIDLHEDDYKVNLIEGTNDFELEKIDPNYVEYIRKTVMCATNQNEYQLVFSVEGKEKEFENLGLKSTLALVEKAFNNIVSSDENKLVKHINKGTIYIDCKIGETTKIYLFEGMKFEEIKEIHQILSKVYHDNANFLTYNESLEKMERL